MVLPEHDMGERVAHLVTGRMLDYIEFEDDFAMVKTVAPEDSVGMPLSDSALRADHGITVVGVKRPGDGLHGLVVGLDEAALHACHRRAPSRRRGPTQWLLLEG